MTRDGIPAESATEASRDAAGPAHYLSREGPGGPLSASGLESGETELCRVSRPGRAPLRIGPRLGAPLVAVLPSR
ncbi:hypothetical protein CA984_17115 [Streptosporangium minutum]|uniref:Uncharacterized protein n=1 Tax=Streptosporangium minutum TaxID=569862 RepID=A0A243RLX2_9ACTN|nr:hypothetical protein CA984_17115 [Streptosporangium minutum]